MIGRPPASAHIDVWLISACRCGIFSATSADAKTALVKNDLLPAKVNNSTNYKIADLYQ